MFNLEKIEEIIKCAKIIKQEIISHKKASDRWIDKDHRKWSQPDLAQKWVHIHKLRHELHCLCVEFWIASYEEDLYWDKIQHNWRNETLVNYRKPLI